MSIVFPTRIRLLKLNNFRNYRSLSLRFSPSSVVLTGPNGSGKTNLLEAVSFLSPGRGLRRAQYADVALNEEKGGDGGWAVAMQVETQNGTCDLGSGLSMQCGVPDKARRIRLDRQPVASANTLTDHMRVLWLTPAMDRLFSGPAGDRRRFLDRLVLAIDPDHGRRVTDFDKAVRHRNRILCEAFHQTEWLDANENQIAALGTAITMARVELLELLRREIESSRHLSPYFPRAELALHGSLDERISGRSALEMEEEYRNRLVEERRRDQAARRTLEGPHRSDLLIRHVQKDMAAHLCSTGEQKALLIGLFLAHARLVSSIAGMAPILLLDEVAAHLDAWRRKALFDVLEALDCQAFMTGTDRELFLALEERAQYFHVEDGRLI